MSKNKKNVFVDTIHMETQTVFQADGAINIFPCSFERGQQIVAGGRIMANQKGRMVTADDGTSHFQPYRSGSGSRYQLLDFADYGVMKESQKQFIFRFAFPKTWPMEKIFEEMRAEINDWEYDWNHPWGDDE